MLGNLPFPRASAGQGGDQLVSKAVTAAISALLKQTEELDVKVKAEPVAKLFQGSVDGFDFVGRGMLMHSGLRVEVMELYVQAVSIDFGAIFRGKVKLRQPTQASMRVVLTEDDLTASFNTPFLIEKLQQLSHEGQPLTFERTQITINDDRSLRMQSSVRQGRADQVIEVDITAHLDVEDRRKLQFVDVVYGGDAQAVELGQVLTAHVNNLLDLDQFSLDGMQLRVDQLRLRNKQLTLYGIAHIEKFPQRNT
ncbi:hypothetical protein C1752_02313 [Acaryochloris thomasi RCC1774]|uniref:DUF2993 domain-containing protein n=1 Tax=Acaryochloris thomasi RCC1774 TaxID=1764569 RepID=A0A2W1JX84_9CYAN|nr:DUF2993 domain-containing protein [Acaryochloris thomasi]PZD73271.1 hypothetical protein C1752_02313 [Acaryochloris thomasi RCC1774]